MTDLLLHTTPPTGLSVSTLIAVDPGSAGWEFCSLTVLRLTPGTSWRGKTGPDEVALVPLSGSCTVRSGEHEWGIGGRENVFAGPTSSVYLPINTEYQVRAEDDARAGHLRVARPAIVSAPLHPGRRGRDRDPRGRECRPTDQPHHQARLPGRPACWSSR